MEENLALFGRMTAGELADGDAVLRLKIDMAAPNMNMRDPAILACLEPTHLASLLLVVCCMMLAAAACCSGLPTLPPTRQAIYRVKRAAQHPHRT